MAPKTPFSEDAPLADQQPRWGNRRQFGDGATAALVFVIVLLGVVWWVSLLPTPMRVSNIQTFARYHGVIATAVEMGLDVPYVESLTGMDASAVGLHALAAKVAHDVRAAKTAQTSAAAMRTHLAGHFAHKIEQQRALQRAEDAERRRGRPVADKAADPVADPSADATTDGGLFGAPPHLDLTPEELAAIRVEQQRAIRRARKATFRASGRRKSPFRAPRPDSAADVTGAADTEASGGLAFPRVTSAALVPSPPPVRQSATRPVLPGGQGSQRGKRPSQRRSSGLGKRGKVVLRAAKQQVKPVPTSAKQILTELNSGEWLFGGGTVPDEAAAALAAAASGNVGGAGSQLRHLEWDVPGSAHMIRGQFLLETDWDADRDGDAGGELTDWAESDGSEEALEISDETDDTEDTDSSDDPSTEDSEESTTESGTESEDDDSTSDAETGDSTGGAGTRAGAERQQAVGSAASGVSLPEEAERDLQWKTRYMGWAGRSRTGPAAGGGGTSEVQDSAEESTQDRGDDSGESLVGGRETDRRGDAAAAGAFADDPSEQAALMGRMRVIRRIYGDGNEDDEGEGEEAQESDGEESTMASSSVVVVRRRQLHRSSRDGSRD